MLEKVCNCPKALLRKKYCVNRCKVTYFCIINQFRGLLEKQLPNSNIWVYAMELIIFLKAKVTQ
jgi:hypothetical protein